MITKRELLDALDSYARSTQADVHPADFPAIADLLLRWPSDIPELSRGIQIGNGNVQTNTWSRW